MEVTDVDGKSVALLLAIGLATAVIPGQASADQSATVNESEFKLDPNAINATTGQVVHFTVKNNGKVEHNFKVELPSANIEQQLFDTNLKPGETRTADFTFAQTGKWEMYCPVDGHEDLGMKGDITVAAAAAAPGPAPAAPPAVTAPAPIVAPPPAPAAAAPVAAPAAQPAGRATPAQLPRTGGPVLPLAVTLAGLGLLAGGIVVRRR